MKMSNPATLQSFKEGYDSRRHIKQKGDISRQKIAKQVLNTLAEPPEKTIQHMERLFPNFFKKNKKQKVELLMTMRIALEAFVSGDVRAYEALMLSAYGKPKESIDLTSGGQSLIRPTPEQEEKALKALKDIE